MSRLFPSGPWELVVRPYGQHRVVDRNGQHVASLDRDEPKISALIVHSPVLLAAARGVLNVREQAEESEMDEALDALEEALLEEDLNNCTQ